MCVSVCFIPFLQALTRVQKKHRCHRDAMAEHISKRFHAYVKDFPGEAVNFRTIFQSELFGLALKQVGPFIFSQKLLYSIQILFPSNTLG